MKKRSKITFSWILVICLLLSSLPGAAPAAAAEADQAPGIPIAENAAAESPEARSENSVPSGDISILQEDTALRKEYEKHFLMSDGSYQVALYNEPVHKLENGAWVEIDNTLALGTAADGTARYATVNGLSYIGFSPSFGSRLVTMRQDEYSVSWGVQAVSDRASVTASSSAEVSRPVQAEPVTADLSAFSPDEQKTLAAKSSSTIQYRNALRQNVDLEYIVLPTRLKENIILQSAQDISYYMVTVYTENLSARLLENREIELYNDSGDVIFTMTSPYMYDSAGELSEEITVEMTPSGNGCYLIKMTPDARWLADASRVYPVVIDPQVSVDTTRSNIIDNYVLKGSGVQNRNLDRLYIGNRSEGLTRAFIQYATMPTIPEGSTITAATMSLTFTNGTDTAANASAYQVTGADWASGTIQWSNMPTAATALATNISHNNLTGYSFSCLNAVRTWYTGDTTGQNANYGIMLQYYDETVADYNAVYSADYTDESKRPALTITYTTGAIIADGVYFIRSSGTGLYLGTSGSFAENTSVKLLSNAASGLAKVRQLWKVAYLGGGYYSVRPLHKLDMGLHVTSNNVDITTITGSGDGLDNVLSPNRWKITAASGDRCYISNADATSYAITYPNGVISPGINAVTASNTKTSSFEWEFVELNDATSGLVLYDTSTNAAVVNPARYITEGETCTLGEYKLQPMTYSAEGLQTASLQWTYSGTAVNVSATTGAVTGWSYSTASTVITGSNEYGSVQFTVSYLDICEGTYFIQNAGNSKYAGYDRDFTGAGALISAQAFDGGSSQSWHLDHLGDGSFHIKTVNTSPAYYLGVQGNSTESGARIVLQSGSADTAARWRIEQTTNNLDVTYKLIPDTGDSSEFVLASGSTLLEQRAYGLDTDFTDEWKIHLHKDYTLMYLGVTEGETEIIPVFNAVKSAMATDAEMDGYAYTSMTTDELKEYLASCKIFSCVTHGEPTYLKTSNEGTFTIADVNAFADDSFDDLQLVYLGACLTGQGESGANNLVNALHSKGADVVIGFTHDVDSSEAYYWTEAFMQSIAKGNTVGNAIAAAIDAAERKYGYDVSINGFIYYIGQTTLAPCG